MAARRRVVSNNTRTGGTCFGDSGGPKFDTTDSLLIVGVTSFGYSPTFAIFPAD